MCYNFLALLDVTAQMLFGAVILTPSDTISAQKRTTTAWVAIRGAHKISKKTKKSTKGNTNELIHRRSYADVTAAPAYCVFGNTK